MIIIPAAHQVLGLVGTNGIGKSTALQVLAGKLKPNLGRYDGAPDWSEILTYFRGSELQNYFTRILEDNLKVLLSNKTCIGASALFKRGIGARVHHLASTIPIIYMCVCLFCPIYCLICPFYLRQ